MSQEKKYDIFISYRRKDTGQRAEHLKDLLDNDYNDRISFDRENLTGLFDVELARRIDTCVDFLLLIDEKSLVYTAEDNSDENICLYNYLAAASIDDFEAKINELGPEYPLDFVRIEIARALHRRDANIIPIVPETSDKFNFAKLYLPKDIVGLKRYDAIFFSKNKDSLFKDILNKLRHHLKTPKTTKKVISAVDSVVYKIRVDRKCTLFIDDEYYQDIEANKLTKISLPKGEYLRKVVDIEDESVYDETEIQLIEGSKLDDVQLNGLFQSAERVKAERAEEEKRKMAERARQEEERIRKEKELQAQIAQAEAAKKALEEKMRLAEEKARQAEEKANQIEKRRLAERQAREYLQKNKVEKPQELPKIETNLSVNDLCKNADNYYYGRNGVKKDYIEAFKYYQKAADKGSSHAQVRIAECYNMGRGVRLDKKEAFKWYRMAAEQGNMHAQFILGEAYETGEYGVQENREMSLKWYQRAADQGNVNAKNKVANLSSVFVDKWLKKAHDCFYGRNGVSLDYVEAAKYYQKVAELGNSHAQSNLGYCYYFGKGVKQNYSEAVRWFREAANKNDEYAQYFLGCCYYYGKGLTVDYSEAFKWYLKSGEAGFGESQYWLGICYYYGQGVMVDFKESTKWFLRSANKGHIEAQFTVGLAYEHGHGVEINISEANKWYRKAAEQGHEKAIKKINELGSINESKHRVKGYDNSKTFDVILKSAGVSKLQVVKTIKEQTGYGLKESKDIVDAAPSFIKRNVDKVIAERIKKELEDIGAIVELR